MDIRAALVELDSELQRIVRERVVALQALASELRGAIGALAEQIPDPPPRDAEREVFVLPEAQLNAQASDDPPDPQDGIVSGDSASRAKTTGPVPIVPLPKLPE